MFNLNKIKFVKSDSDRKNMNGENYSFVGLKKTEEDGFESEFWLPLGFDAFGTETTNPTSFDRVKKFFFKMYRTFQTYKIRKLKQLTEEEKTKKRDGVFEFENGFSFINENNEQVVFYGKLNALDKILEGYDELRISSLEKKQVRSHEIDYSKIHKYMHQAIYLDDDVIYLDEMNIAKNILMQESPPILQLFCFIYTEIKKELEELDSISDKASELADLFKDNYLQPNSSLFTEDSFADTINILKNIFEEIDNKTSYKDEDFWHFYEAIEAFLMGERQEYSDDGVYFGINNFYDVWEDMCQTYMLNPENKYLQQVLFADKKFIKNGKLGSELHTRERLGLKHELKTNPFIMEINNGFNKRFLRPDLVILSKLEINDIIIKEHKYVLHGKSFTKREIAFPEGVEQEYQKLYEIYKKHRKPDRFNIFYIFQSDYFNFTQEIEKYISNKYGLLEKKPCIVKSNIQIIDYKYMRLSDYNEYTISSNKEGNKIKADIDKQLLYEWAIQQNFENSKTTSEFWIPYYNDDEKLGFEDSKNDVTEDASDDFKQSQIKIMKINFKILQENYVKLYKTL